MKKYIDLDDYNEIGGVNFDKDREGCLKSVIIFAIVFYSLIYFFIASFSYPITSIVCDKETNTFTITQNFVNSKSYKLFENRTPMVNVSGDYSNRGWVNYFVMITIPEKYCDNFYKTEMSNKLKKYNFDTSFYAYNDLNKKISNYLNNSYKISFKYFHVPFFWIGLIPIILVLIFIKFKNILWCLLLLQYPFLYAIINQIISIVNY